MSVEANKEIVRRYQEAYNANNLDALVDLVAEAVLMPKSLPGFPAGLEGAKAIHRTTLTGMPDFHTKIEDLIGEGDLVAARIRMTGTHTGEFFGIPPTGKHVDVTGMYFARIAGGKIVEHWGEEDGLSLLRQLGAMK